MNTFLTSNEWQWRLARTVLQGIIGVLVANIDDLARRVIDGEFGNGQERQDRLGVNYAAVQARVNEMLR